MTQKHFVALAEALKRTKPVDDTETANEYNCAKIQWERDLQAIVNVCIEHGPRFNKSKFLSYIGVDL